MSSSLKAGWAALLLAVGATCAQAQAPADPAQRFPGVGRAATPAEVKAWDIDVRPDFKGLPKGSGSVAKGQDVWEAKCASCHGVFGESNEVFAPLVGGTTEEDIKNGRVANLRRADYPGRTTLMKLAHVSTLWDYINRAMPWNAPKSLSVEEVYAVTGYLLHLGGIVPADFTLGDANIAEVQQRLPNRKGMSTAHAMWPGAELGGARAPDVQAQACMKDCPVEPKVASMLPDFARDAHGNLADQNRLVGPQRGARTVQAAAKPAAASAPAKPSAPAGAAASVPPADAERARALAQSNNCTACHAADRRIVGPSWAEIAGKHAGKTDYLSGKIRAGGSGVWGSIPMPPQSLGEADATLLARWLAGGAP
ncbi:c-type cytochrome [Ramlibacter rhizophilus]|uniref:C-type cytochrome n=1 Tax=Ramlibacter rhizophilus TaxID=1781167 RepID=A0A4Z0C2B4_9BURK|nr:c-type cytochrome [Ramlibacter rhizophilus]TFZ04365.1 c-type cytochrome [Ramlibacter rhizophilus]